MSHSGIIFPGIIACFAVSLAATVIIPNSQLGSLSPEIKEEDGRFVDAYPVADLSLAARGKEVYVSQGCQSCHTQVVLVTTPVCHQTRLPLSERERQRENPCSG